MIRIQIDSDADPDKLASEAAALAAEIKPLLAGRNSCVQGAVLSELTALWIAGHAPQLRDDVMRGHIVLIDKLVPVVEQAMFGVNGFPERFS